jgi:hypothetical protein
VTLAVVVPLVAVAALVTTCTWVYRDAGANAAAGTPVYVQVGSLRIDTPQAWAISCAAFFVLFVPLYLAARDS